MKIFQLHKRIKHKQSHSKRKLKQVFKNAKVALKLAEAMKDCPIPAPNDPKYNKPQNTDPQPEAPKSSTNPS